MSDATQEKEFNEARRLSDIQYEYYPKLQEEEGIPVYTGFYFEDLTSIELKPCTMAEVACLMLRIRCVSARAMATVTPERLAQSRACVLSAFERTSCSHLKPDG